MTANMEGRGAYPPATPKSFTGDNMDAFNLPARNGVISSNPSASASVVSLAGASVINTDVGRILCVADVRGKLSQLNELAVETNARYIIHTGDFGFYEMESLDRISDRTLKHLIQYSTLIPPHVRSRFNSLAPNAIRDAIRQSTIPYLSEFPSFLSGEKSLMVPTYTVWGACEDVSVLEKFRRDEYKIPNLHVLDEANSHLIDVGGVGLRLFGLGGAIVSHKLFDNGEGVDTIAGGQGTMWTTALQIGELVETAQRYYNPAETRVLVTHASPGREGLLAQLGLVLRADFTISAGLHFRYGISYNEFSIQPDQEHFRNRLMHSQKNFMHVWDAISDQVESSVDERQNILLQNFLNVVNRIPSSIESSPPSTVPQNDELAFKNMWNFNLPDAAFGWLVLNVNNGRVSAESKQQGFNFQYRRSTVATVPPNQPHPTPLNIDTSFSSPIPVAPVASVAPVAPVAPMAPVTPQERSQSSLDRYPMFNGINEDAKPTAESTRSGTSWDQTASAHSQRSEPSRKLPSLAKGWNEPSENAYTVASPVTTAFDNGASEKSGGGSSWGGEAASTNSEDSRRKRQSVYVKNLNSVHVSGFNTVSEEDLKRFFGNYGIERVYIVSDKDPNSRRGYAYVDFENPELAIEACKLNGQLLNETPIRVAPNTSGTNQKKQLRSGRAKSVYIPRTNANET